MSMVATTQLIVLYVTVGFVCFEFQWISNCVRETCVGQVRGFLMETILVSMPKITENYQK